MGEGDKETFIHAAMALEAPFYDVKTPVTVMGAWINGTFMSAGMKQGDPLEDHSLQTAKKKNDKATEKPVSDQATPETFARSLFVHNKIMKIDVNHLFDDPYRWKNETGHSIRLWGEEEGLVHEFGYDIEKVLWEELLIAACDIGEKICTLTKDHIKQAFPGIIDVGEITNEHIT